VSEAATYDENSTNSAVELGLMVCKLIIKDSIVLLLLFLKLSEFWFAGGKCRSKYALCSVTTNYAHDKAISYSSWP
jgi:hypothetical protein